MNDKYQSPSEKEAFADGWNEGYENGYEQAAEDSNCWYVLDANDDPIRIGDLIQPTNADFRASYRVVGLGEYTVLALCFEHEVGGFSASDVKRVRR